MLTQIATQVALLCSFRILPIAIHACARGDIPRRARVAVGCGYAALAVLTWWLGAGALLGWSILGVSGYLACCLLVPACARALAAGKVSAGALFVGFTTLFLVLPALLLPDVAPKTFLVLGWELVLSSYSYCRCHAHGGGEPERADCLFFLFVNPTLSYAHRGHWSGIPSRFRIWAGRALLGVGAIALATLLKNVATPALSRVVSGSAHPRVLAMAFGLLIFFREYVGQSGLASLQIGLLRQLGYTLPERYRQPWAARDPLDFWRRWNIYVADWLRDCVFVPLTRGADGKLRRGARRWLPFAATFAVSAGLHDGYSYLASRTFEPRATQFFLVCLVLALLWGAAASALDRVRALPSQLGVRALASRVLLWFAVAGCGLIWA